MATVEENLQAQNIIQEQEIIELKVRLHKALEQVQILGSDAGRTKLQSEQLWMENNQAQEDLRRLRAAGSGNDVIALEQAMANIMRQRDEAINSSRELSLKQNASAAEFLAEIKGTPTPQLSSSCSSSVLPPHPQFPGTTTPHNP